MGSASEEAMLGKAYLYLWHDIGAHGVHSNRTVCKEAFLNKLMSQFASLRAFSAKFE